MGKPFPGIEATVLDPRTNEPHTAPGRVGLIALKPGWPSMMRGYWKNPTAFQNKFRNGWYLCGDRASIDPDGYFWFVGRDDDVINTGGHLVGPFEIESALLEHPAVAESAAVAKPDPINMEVVKAFVTLKPGYEPSDDLELEIMNTIRRKRSRRSPCRRRSSSSPRCPRRAAGRSCGASCAPANSASRRATSQP